MAVAGLRFGGGELSGIQQQFFGFTQLSPSKWLENGLGLESMNDWLPRSKEFEHSLNNYDFKRKAYEENVRSGRK